MTSADDLAAFEDTLDLLSNPAAMEEIRQAQEDIRQGKGINGEDLVAKYLDR